jgi:hypothetical protein
MDVWPGQWVLDVFSQQSGNVCFSYGPGIVGSFGITKTYGTWDWDE